MHNLSAFVQVHSLLGGYSDWPLASVMLVEERLRVTTSSTPGFAIVGRGLRSKIVALCPWALSAKPAINTKGAADLDVVY